MRRRGLILLAVLLIAAGPRSHFFHLVNRARDNAGCSAVEQTGPRLTARAHEHSRAMADAGYLFHSHLHVGHWSAVGEIIGVALDVRSLFRAYMHSPKHREIITDCDYDLVSIGFVRDEGLWHTSRFYAR